MSGLIGIVVLVLDIVAILDILKSGKTGGYKALWIVVVLLLPLIGMAAYFVVGKKK